MASQSVRDKQVEDLLKEPHQPKGNDRKKMAAWHLLRKFLRNGKFVWQPVLLIFLNGIYLLFGGAVFLFLEKKEPVQLSISTEIIELLQALNETKADTINSSLVGRTIYETAGNMTASDIEKWRKVLGSIYERRVSAEYPQWTLFRSIFFCTTLLTTIGYGNIAPTTTAGRIFCVIYSFVGIPFNIMFLAVLGKLMANIINKMCAEIIRLWTSYLHPNYEWKSLKGDTEINAPVWLALVIFGSFLCFCAWIYSISEGWDYWTACYFTFITFTTIGLGDIVPERAETMVLIDTTLLYLGLAVLALTVNLIVANMLHQMRKTREKLPFVGRLEMSSVTPEPSETKEDKYNDLSN